MPAFDATLKKSFTWHSDLIKAVARSLGGTGLGSIYRAPTVCSALNKALYLLCKEHRGVLYCGL